MRFRGKKGKVYTGGVDGSNPCGAQRTEQDVRLTDFISQSNSLQIILYRSLDYLYLTNVSCNICNVFREKGDSAETVGSASLNALV